MNHDDAPAGPQNYAERRLLDIAKAVDSIKSWVTFFGIVMILQLIGGFILLMRISNMTY